MAFVDYEFYKSLYGADAIDEPNFNRLLWSAENIVRNQTTGVDGLCKLDISFPTLERDAEAVKRCICEIVNTSCAVEVAEKNAQDGKVIASVHAGNESISYATNAGLINSVSADVSAQNNLYSKIVDKYLRNVKDNNGVNILFRGVYPYIVKY